MFVTFSSFFTQHYAPLSQALALGLLLLNFHNCSPKCFLSLFFFFWHCFIYFITHLSMDFFHLLSCFSTLFFIFLGLVWIFLDVYGTVVVVGYCLYRQWLFWGFDDNCNDAVTIMFNFVVWIQGY